METKSEKYRDINCENTRVFPLSQFLLAYKECKYAISPSNFVELRHSYTNHILLFIKSTFCFPFLNCGDFVAL